jgi:Glucose-regulated metallo-peptidase M90
MKSGKFIVLFILALNLVSCSKPSGHLLIKKISQYPKQEMSRHVATIEAQKCLKDVFTVEVVKKEIKEIEDKFSNLNKVSGKWKHLDLSSLPVPQANFLKKYGHRLGDLNNAQAFDFSSCKDVPCVFNKIYQKEGDVAGYVHYLWYLKMGNLLAATNTVYNAKSQTKPGIYNGKEFPVSAYLYRENELYAFWRLLQLLREPHTKLSDFTEIHRVPQGESFDFEVEERKTGGGGFGETCGLAWSSGYVILQDFCLQVSSDKDFGYFYQAVMHEITHQVDYHQGREKKGIYRSSEKDYLDVAKFYLKEFKDESGKTVRQWEHHEGIKLVSSYAGTSPAENFAETISLFRLEGTKTRKSISEDHWNFVSDKYFFDSSFENKELMKNWLAKKSSELSSRSFQMVEECSKTTQAYKSNYFTKSDFIVPILPAMVQCLGARSNDLSLDFSSEIKTKEIEGCSILNAYQAKDEWDVLFKSETRSYLNKYLKQLQMDPGYFAKIQSFMEKIPEKEMAIDAFLTCGDPEEEESCYKEEVHKKVINSLASLDLPEAHSEDLARLYSETHTFESIKSYLSTYYKAFIQSEKLGVESAAKKLWDSCHELPPSDDASPRGRIFTIREGYLISSLYNCLNENFNFEVDGLVKQLSYRGEKIQHPKEEILIKAEVVPEFLTLLESLLLEARKKEALALQAFADKEVAPLRAKLTADFNWVSDVVSDLNIQRDCQNKALKEISFSVLYDQKSVVFSKLVKDVCFNITQSSSYLDWIEKSKTELTSKSYTNLETRVYSLGVEEAKKCLVSYPVDTSLNRTKFKKDREDCLLNAWTNLESQAVREFQADPLVIKFQIDVAALKSKLDLSRRRLQLKIFKEHF